MAAAAGVLALALGSAAVWVLFAAPAPPATGIGADDWWPAVQVLPNR